jgi:hypothetical protein
MSFMQSAIYTKSSTLSCFIVVLVVGRQSVVMPSVVAPTKKSKIAFFHIGPPVDNVSGIMTE